MRTYAEKFGPYALALLFASLFYGLDVQFPESRDGLLGASVTMASVMIGFLGVMKAIIISLRNGRAYGHLKKTRMLSRLFRYMKEAFVVSSVFAAVSIVLFFIDKDWYATIYTNTFWVFIGSSALFTYVRLSMIMFRILDYDTKNEERSESAGS